MYAFYCGETSSRFTRRSVAQNAPSSASRISHALAARDQSKQQSQPSLPTYGQCIVTSAILSLLVLLFCTQAHADTFRTGDISVSNVNGLPTQNDADIAHVSLVIVNAGADDDVLIDADVPPQYAAGAGFHPLPLRVYRGAGLKMSQPVFLKAGQTRSLGFDDLHLLIYGIQGAYTRGFQLPVRLTFEKAGTLDIIVSVGGEALETSDRPADKIQPHPLKAMHQAPTRPDQRDEPFDGAAFRCEDGGKLLLSFSDSSGMDALIWLNGVRYRLRYQTPEPGPAQVVWSDGENSLTWSSGVRLTWMDGASHLMCGRGGHQH